MYFLVFWVPGYEPWISFGESHFTNGYFICKSYLKKFKIHLNKPKLKIVPIFGRSNGLFMNDNPK